VAFLTRLVIKHPKRFAIFGSLLGILAIYFSALLYRGLRPDIEELLPSTSRSVLDLEQLTRRLGSFENLVVLVFSKDTKASLRFVDDLAAALNTVPRDTIARIDYRIRDEAKFFRDRQALFLSVPDLSKVRDYIGARVLYEKTVRNPIRLFPLEDLKEPKLDFEKLGEGRSADVERFAKFKDGYYALEDESVRAMIVYMPSKGLKVAHRMRAAIGEKVAALNPSSYAADLEVKYSGNVQNLIEESSALIADLEFSTVVCMVLVALSLLVFFKSWVATSALMLSLLVGTFWTFGLSYFLVGYLNANTAFLASIVLGNGINFGIILVARYMEERRAGQAAEAALSIAMTMSAAATSTAALAAGLAYASLMMTSFRGFSQFGVIGLTGMVLCWISAYTILPAYLLLAEKWIKRDLLKPAKEGRMMSALAHFVDRRAALVAVFVVIFSVGSFVTIGKFNYELVETDLTKLRDRKSMSVGSGALYRYILEIFGRSASPLIVLPTEREGAVKIAQILRADMKSQGAESPVKLVQTIEDFVPGQQPEKIAILREIELKMDPKVLKFAPKKDQDRIKEILNPNVFKAFSEEDLPALIRFKFSEVDNSYGKIVLVEKHAEDDTRNLERFLMTVRSAADSVVPGTPVAGETAITYDLVKAIVNDGPRVTLYALILVVLLVAVSFRDVKSTGLALFALALGMLWFLGIILGFKMKLNFLNFIAFPITFGIGVDYGVNMFQRFREDRNANILHIIRSTGGAVVLCSITTVIGYSSLLMAGNRAFVSFGALAVIGEITCIVAAVLALPAFLRLRKPSGMPGTIEPETEKTAASHS
jgi:uncharacterized protein